LKRDLPASSWYWPSLWGFALVKTQALTLAGIIAALKEEKLVPKSETNGRYALTDTLKRAGLSAQKEAACP
jgi:hypothetical protein